MKAVVAAFNQEKALVGAFSVITNLRIAFVSSTTRDPGVAAAALFSAEMKTLARIFQELRASVELCPAVPGRAAAVRGRTQGSLINDVRFFSPCQSFLVIAHWTIGFLGTWLCYHLPTHAEIFSLQKRVALATDMLIDGHLWTVPQWRVSRGG